MRLMQSRACSAEGVRCAARAEPRALHGHNIEGARVSSNPLMHPPRQTGSWTTVSEFKKNVLAALAVLDTTLPKGSHVAFLGLVDGRVLFDTTHTLTHPLGIT